MTMHYHGTPILEIVLTLRLENDEPGNTWYSRGVGDEPDLQVHMDTAFYEALGKPNKLVVTLRPSAQELSGG